MAKVKKNVKKKSKVKDKKEVEAVVEDFSVVGRLTPAQYFEWKCNMDKITIAKHVATITSQKLKIMELESAINRLRTDIFKQSVKDANKNADTASSDFQSFRKKLEDEIGFKLEDCLIDEFSYTIKKIPK